jgi:hypothetical protein
MINNSKQKLFYNMINFDMPSSSNDDINLMDIYQEGIFTEPDKPMKCRSMEKLLKERENDLNNNIFEKTIKNPIIEDPDVIKNYIDYRDDIETYYENIKDMKNAKQKSPINYKIKMNDTYINNINFQGTFGSIFLVKYKDPKITLKYVSKYQSNDNNKNLILLPSDFKFEENSNYEFNCNIQFIISTALHEYKYIFNKKCNKMRINENCYLIQFKTSTKKNDYSGDLVFFYNNSNNSMSFKSCDIVLSETTLHDMDLPI